MNKQERVEAEKESKQHELGGGVGGEEEGRRRGGRRRGRKEEGEGKHVDRASNLKYTSIMLCFSHACMG